MTETREFLDYEEDSDVKEFIVHFINCWDFFIPISPRALKVTVVYKKGKKRIRFEILKGQEVMDYPVSVEECKKLADWLQHQVSE